jgi:hypothetical protein
MRSGNLNFTIPLIKAMSRGGGGTTFNLSYNSQNWRQDPGGEWQLGRDIGYGYGWRLSAGSITPIYDSIWGLDHYEFTDSTGALCRLDQNNNGVWSSKQSIYVYYNSNSKDLFFTDDSQCDISLLGSGGRSRWEFRESFLFRSHGWPAQLRRDERTSNPPPSCRRVRHGR